MQNLSANHLAKNTKLLVVRIIEIHCYLIWSFPRQSVGTIKIMQEVIAMLHQECFTGREGKFAAHAEIKIKELTIIFAAFFALNANADLCPKDGEAIVTTPYQLSIACPAATVIVKGERNPDEYASCLGDTPYAKEQVFYIGNNKNQMPLPTVNSLLPANHEFKNRLWVVGDLSTSIQCVGPNGVSIDFWAGGNCTGCTRIINYVFNPDGALQRAELK